MNKLGQTRWVVQIMAALAPTIILGAAGIFIALPILREQMSQVQAQIAEIKQVTQRIETAVNALTVRTAVNEVEVQNLKDKGKR